MVDKNSILQIFGSLMKKPNLLSESDKYQLTLDDFYYKFDKYVFAAIENLYRGGANRIQPIDVENYLQTNGAASIIFKKNNGIEFLQDAEYLSELQNFDFYYKRLKKINLLTKLQDNGFDISEFYIEDLTNPKALDVNKNFETLEIDDILDALKRKVLNLENQFTQNEVTQTESAFEGIEDIIKNAVENVDIGAPVQGELLNEVMSGARLGTFIVRSAASGTGKTRQAVGDACLIAYPFRYEPMQRKWMQIGSGRKVMFIATEQTIPEIQKMILAYLTGFNESKFRYGQFTKEEERIIRQAVWIMERYKDNFFIVQMPSPRIDLVKNLVREQVLLHGIEYVFYDYIFISPSLLTEFKGVNLRNDEILLMFSTALKELAVELNVCVFSSTQVNANADSNVNIRNESSIAGSRAIINKADIGMVMARPTKEEIDFFASMGEATPTMVTDVYKVRSGAWTQVRIWSTVDLGNLRKVDLYITNSRLEMITDFEKHFLYQIDWEGNDFVEVEKKVNELT